MTETVALANLNVTYIQQATVIGKRGDYPRQASPQVRLSAISGDCGEKRYGGEITVYEGDPSYKTNGLWRQFDTGLFQVWVSVDRRTLDLLWQAYSSPHDWFVVLHSSLLR
jgi:hypothetical protein